jgi:hypothetical protein
MKWSLILTVLIGASVFAQGFLVGPTSFDFTFLWILVILGAIWTLSALFYLLRREWKSLGFMTLPVVVSFALYYSATGYQKGQVETARAIGDQVIARIVAYQKAKGAPLPTFEDLVAFDSQPIPTTEMGLWDCGAQEFVWGQFGMVSFKGFRANTHMNLAGDGWSSTREFSQEIPDGFSDPSAAGLFKYNLKSD